MRSVVSMCMCVSLWVMGVCVSKRREEEKAVKYHSIGH